MDSSSSLTAKNRGTGKNIPFDCKAWGANDTNDGPARRDILPQADLTEVLYDWGKSITCFLVKTTNVALIAWNGSTYFSERCATTQADNGRFLSTAFVARDMLQIVDALEEDGLLRYWGTSYGTLLGNTFAAMFPDRIDRMMLDSVVNPLDYMAGYWLTATLDTDKVFLGFLDTCVKAGPELCAIANFSGPDTTADDLLQLTYDMFEYLLESGLPLGANLTSALWDKDQPGTVYYNLKSILFEYLYSPSTWPLGAQLLQAFLLQDFSIFTESLNETTNLIQYSEGVDAFWGIACSDSSFRAIQPEDMQWLVDAQQNVSTFDDILAPQMWPCYQWKLEAAERYSGNFQVKTSHPILYVNGLADPITPAVSAFNASSGFDGSVVLTHGGYGHGFYSDPSLDVARAIQTYFVKGTLPPEGQYFEADFGPFELPDLVSILNGSYFDGIQKRSGEAYSEDDKTLLQAMFGLSEYHRSKGRHGFLNLRPWL